MLEEIAWSLKLQPLLRENVQGLNRCISAQIYPPHMLGFQGPSGGNGGRRRNPHAGSSGKKAKAQESVTQPVHRPQEVPWTYFCDFHDITHVVLRECHVSIHCQDKSLVRPKTGGWAGAVPPACDTCLTSPWPIEADSAFPGHGPVLGITGGWLFPPDGRLKPLPMP